MPSGGCVYNVVSCVDHVVIDVIIVDICGCCDCMIHGEVVVILIMIMGRLHLGFLLLSWLCYCG